MKTKKMLLPVLCAAALLGAVPAKYAAASGAPLGQLHELWTGSVYTSTFKAGFCLNHDDVKGVLLLKTITGKVDVYHFYGKMHDGLIEAWHNSGHKFKGKFKSDSEVQGTLKLKNGRTINMTAHRYHNADLTDSCRPKGN